MSAQQANDLARISPTERQLIEYDCNFGSDQAACQNLLITFPFYHVGGVEQEAVRRIRGEHEAELRQLCDQKELIACSELGAFIWKTNGGFQPEAHALLAQGCDGGDWRACVYLSDFNFNAQSVEQGPQAREYYLELQAECRDGDAGACVSQSRLNVLISSVVPDQAIWHDALIEFCDDDNARACAVLSYLYSEASGYDEYSRFLPEARAASFFSDRKANRFALRACDLGHPSGCYNAGLNYSFGDGVRESWATGQRYLARSCQAGMWHACDELSYEPYWRRTDALSQLVAACKIGDINACYHKAAQENTPLLTDAITPEDTDRMAKYRAELTDICKRGFAEACADVAVLSRASGMLHDAERFGAVACNLLVRAGCTAVGNILKLDRRTPDALLRSVGYLQEGCDLGARVACNNLGDSYERGLGVSQDFAQAARLYSIACTQELGLGCKNLWELYLQSDPDAAQDALTRACSLDARYCD